MKPIPFRFDGAGSVGIGVVLLALSCDATADKGSECPPSSSNAGGGGEAPGGADTAPAGVDCTFFFRESTEVGEGESPEDPKFQFEERVVSVAKNEDESVTLGKLTVNLRYDDSEHEGSSVGLRVTAADTQLIGSLYQLGSDGLINQFVGDHGFTGLMYLTHPTEGGDYQLICKARSTPR